MDKYHLVIGCIGHRLPSNSFQTEFLSQMDISWQANMYVLLFTFMFYVSVAVLGKKCAALTWI